VSCGLLPGVGLGDADSQCPDATDHADALSDADSAPRIENVEQVRALQSKLVRRQQRKSLLFRRACGFIAKQSLGLRKQAPGLSLVLVEVLQ